MTGKILSDLNKPAMQSKKLIVAIIAIVLNMLFLATALFVFAQVYASKPESADWFGFGGFCAMALAAVNALPLGYVGGTTWQEKAVRVAAIGKGLKDEAEKE